MFTLVSSPTAVDVNLSSCRSG